MKPEEKVWLSILLFFSFIIFIGYSISIHQDKSEIIRYCYSKKTNNSDHCKQLAKDLGVLK